MKRGHSNHLLLFFAGLDQQASHQFTSFIININQYPLSDLGKLNENSPKSKFIDAKDFTYFKREYMSWGEELSKIGIYTKILTLLQSALIY